MSFHSHDNWERRADGSAVVCPPDGRATRILHPSAWASVIASMSAGGETDERFYAAEAFHASRGPIRVEEARR